MACLKNPGCDTYLFRRTRVELENTHIKKLKEEIPYGLGRYNETRNRWEFPEVNGTRSYLNMCYAEHEHDVDKYNSVEFHSLLIDEASRRLLSHTGTMICSPHIWSSDSIICFTSPGVKFSAEIVCVQTDAFVFKPISLIGPIPFPDTNDRTIGIGKALSRIIDDVFAIRDSKLTHPERLAEPPVQSSEARPPFRNHKGFYDMDGRVPGLEEGSGYYVPVTIS